jgi:hypothetical protein
VRVRGSGARILARHVDLVAAVIDPTDHLQAQAA